MKIARFSLLKPLIWVIELIVIISLVGSIISIAKKKDVVGEQAAALKRIDAENARLKSQLSQAQSTVFVENEARDKLGLVKPGEVVVMIGRQVSTASDSLNPQTALPRWQQWWQLFF